MKKISYKERKKYLIRGSILLIVGIISLIGAIYFNIKNKDKNPFETDNNITDSIKFKNEYENLNDKIIKDDKKYMSISINKNNPVKYLLNSEVDDFFNEGTGIIYFGFPECPWCRNLVPVLLDALEEKDINDIYYVNVKEIRDEKVLDDEGKIITKNEGTKIYSKILDKFSDYLPVYEGLNDDSIKRLYVPAVFFLKNGEVIGYHYNTVESQEDPMIPLNQVQYDELKNILIENINKIYNYKCTDGC